MADQDFPRDTEGTGGFQQSADGTLYWTVTLYISANDAMVAAGAKSHHDLLDRYRRLQYADERSRSLALAVNPMFNDIADRDILGKINEFLFAPPPQGDTPVNVDRVERRRLHFHTPDTLRWKTEGVDYQTAPPDLGATRVLDETRFWYSHNNGALSYNLSYKYHYGGETPDEGHSPANFFFISALQKLTAPKEFQLSKTLLDKLRTDPMQQFSVFDEGEFEIDPLDKIMVAVAETQAEPKRFWQHVRDTFDRDASALFDTHLIDQLPGPFLGQRGHRQLLCNQTLPELLGVSMPRARILFHFHDSTFFKRLSPAGPGNSVAAARKICVQDGCYEPYAQRLTQLRKSAAGGAVMLGSDFWDWVSTRPDYLDWIKDGTLVSSSGDRITSFEHLAGLMREGACIERTTAGANPVAIPPIPAFEPQRKDCLDYLFLSGFNQNIIDFMNQDTSEILDSIDPLYPKSEEQANEHFFVRYANSKSMITYVPQSRSLEVGDDYIGTCPYAFLIHVTSLHNEFLSEDHETASAKTIRTINDALAKGENGALDEAEAAINNARVSNYLDYERYVHDNPFRFDTERDVFSAMEKLRGINRKQTAINKAIESLDHATADLQRKQRAREADRSSAEATILNFMLASVGIFGAFQLFYQIAEDQTSDGKIDLGLLGSLSANSAKLFIENWSWLFLLPLFLAILLLVRQLLEWIRRR